MCVASLESEGRQASSWDRIRWKARGENAMEVRLSLVMGGRNPDLSSRRVVSSEKEGCQGASYCWRTWVMMLGMARLTACNEQRGLRPASTSRTQLLAGMMRSGLRESS